MRDEERSLWLGVAIFGMVLLPALMGQDSRPAETGIPSDWSHHHLIFSRPATAEQARRVEQDPRYWQQLDRSQLRTPPSVAEPRQALPSGLRFGGGRGSGPTPGPLQTHRDWSQDLGMGATVGAGNFPAKFSFATTNANCASSGKPDFVVYSTGLAGSSGQASIVAYDNLYTGCTGTVPSVYWAYNTGTGPQILTSPAFSRDGTQVAFVQNDAIGASLVLLKWAASASESVGSPDTLTPVLPSAYQGCAAPCMTTIALTTTGTVTGVPTSDTTSSVFLDLSDDTAWVGDNLGLLHKFSPVFKGTPTEVLANFPAQINSPGAPLSSPVHDFGSGLVFVGDVSGFLYSVDSTAATVTQSGQLDFGVGIVEGPVVDSTSGLVYVFASDGGAGNCSLMTDCAGVYQLSTSFADGDIGAETFVGNSVALPGMPNPMYVGAFDSTYENSTAPPTGNLYVCGNTGGLPTLYQILIAAGGFGTVNAGPVLSSTGTSPPCSPVTDIFTANVSEGASEFIFASTQASGTSTACASGGCIFNFNDTPWQPKTVYAVGQEVVDTHFQIQVVYHGGVISGSVPPNWTQTLGAPTMDAGVRWINQGVSSATTPGPWQASHPYTIHTKILDSNGNIELVTKAGTSGTGTPSWRTEPELPTTDSGVTWTNVGASATEALPEAGGTSGIIIDNTVGSGTIVGGSQVYFSTLSNQACGTSGTGGCAVQASQSDLQ